MVGNKKTGLGYNCSSMKSPLLSVCIATFITLLWLKILWPKTYISSKYYDDLVLAMACCRL
jgi:hypothetical protein